MSGWKKDHTVWHLLNPYFGNNIFPLSQKDYSNEKYDLKHVFIPVKRFDNHLLLMNIGS